MVPDPSQQSPQQQPADDGSSSDHPAADSSAKSGETTGSRRRRRGKSTNQLRRPAFLDNDDRGLRLQKFLAVAGVDSRRNCEAVIREGRITVDGDTITDPARTVFPDRQEIRFDGEKLQPSRYRYYLLNKPRGVVCTHKDPAGRPRAVDLVPSNDGRMFTVGRLDENTLGLLLVTNDGALAEHLAHPRYEVTRTYRVQVVGLPNTKTLAELREGMHFSDGFFRFHEIRILKRKGRSTFLQLELKEGKNREIRRMLARAGHKVIQLERVSFGPLRLGSLEVGTCRELRQDEVLELYQFLETPIGRRSPKRRSVPASRHRSRAHKSRSPSAENSREESGNRGRRGAARKAGPPRPQRPAKKNRRR